MSHKSFSILAFPMIFSKNVFSIRWALPIRKLAKSISKRPKRVVLLGELDSMWFLSIAKAWTWVVSFNPEVSEIWRRKKCINCSEWFRTSIAEEEIASDTFYVRTFPRLHLMRLWTPTILLYKSTNLPFVYRSVR
jgi:hypothetical protein